MALLRESEYVEHIRTIQSIGHTWRSLDQIAAKDQHQLASLNKVGKTTAPRPANLSSQQPGSQNYSHARPS
jgi:hypothetical protein